jgi:mono/diheme cytochrome c family protein
MNFRMVVVLRKTAVAVAVIGGLIGGSVPRPCDAEPFSPSIRAQLAAGKAAYERYCAGCHGDKGDGKGPAALFLNPKPRDFTAGKFKFASVRSGEMPTDEDLHRTISKGLSGTSMPAWPLLPESQRAAVVAYLKTFSARWEQGPGNAIAVPEDPFKGDPKAIANAIQKGEKVYHTLTTCYQCHPGYINAQQMEACNKEAKRTFEGLRPDWNKPVAKEDGWGQMLMPTDFLRDRIKTGLGMDSLFRVIATGIGGTAMPTWKDAIPDDDIWALTYYVRALADQRNARFASLPLSAPRSAIAAAAKPAATIAQPAAKEPAPAPAPPAAASKPAGTQKQDVKPSTNPYE